MVLGRLVAALRAQSWGTVLIELMIVSVGVFLGVQFGNWNDRRIQAEQEQVYLDKLAADFELIAEQLEVQIARSETLLDQAQKLQELVVTDAPLDPQAVDPLLDSLVSASRPGRPSPTFIEMQASGALSRLDDPELRSALINYHLQTEISDRGLNWALEGFHPERKVFEVIGRDGEIEQLRGAYGEITYMGFAHQLQLRYANDALALSQEILMRIEESQQ